MAIGVNNGEPRSDERCDSPFERLIDRVRLRDERSTAELVRLYEPQVLRAVRVRLREPALRQVVDSVDICQSVLANFFVRTASGEFEIDHPRELIALLATMADNKIHDRHRKQRALRRDDRRTVPFDESNLPQLAQRSDNWANRIVEVRELLQEVDRRLPARERRTAKLRSQGYGWGRVEEEC